MNQHTYVENCQRFYLENGLEPGNPDDGKWEEAHYPAPKGKGNDVILLLREHHQVQGLLQSEEWGKTCFFLGHTKHFLTYGSFVDNWFELWDIYDKWVLHRLEELHAEKDENGKSVFAVKIGKAGDHSFTPEACSKGGKIGGTNSHKERDEQGRSVRALETLGDYQFTSETAKLVHEEKLEDGRSKHAVEKCGVNLKAKYRCLHTGFVSSASGIARRQRKLGYESGPDFRVKVII